MFALMLGAKGILNLKGHVEMPQQIPLKNAAIQFLVGGALMALPIIYESMQGSIGTGASALTVATLQNVNAFNQIN